MAGYAARKQKLATCLDTALANRICSVRDRAIKDGLSFDLDVEHLKSIFPEKCPYLNIEITLRDPKKESSFSIDKIIPELGYVKGNVQIISNKANFMKSNATINELLTFSKNVLLLHGAK